MAFSDTNIRWCDKVLNAIHGCSKTSEGCRYCYAERVSHRFGHTEEAWTVANTDANITLKPGKLDARLSSPAWVFVNSMSDLLHEAVPAEFVADHFNAFRDMPESAFLVLTKHGPDQGRPLPAAPPENLLLGVSVESPRRKYRIDWLRQQPATTRFVSFEPVVECIPGTDLDLSGIDWAIIGGESGHERREMSPAWARNLVRSCRRQDVAVFFKQHSGPHPEGNVKLDMGDGPKRIEEFPDVPEPVNPAPWDFLAREVAV